MNYQKFNIQITFLCQRLKEQKINVHPSERFRVEMINNVQLGYEIERQLSFTLKDENENKFTGFLKFEKNEILRLKNEFIIALFELKSEDTPIASRIIFKKYERLKYKLLDFVQKIDNETILNGYKFTEELLIKLQNLNSTLENDSNVQNHINFPTSEKQTSNMKTRPILIITATTNEINSVLQEAKNYIEETPEKLIIENQASFKLGILNETEIYLSRCEAGTSGVFGAQAVISDLISALNPSCVLMPGIAFGLQREDQSIGDILISTHIHQYEKVREGESQKIFRGEKIPSSHKLLSVMRLLEHEWNESKLHFGTIMSGEKLVDDPGFVDRLLKFSPEAIGGEMEGVGLYTASHRKKVDWILFKSIVDWGVGKTDEHQKKAAALSSKLCFQAIDILCKK